MTSKIPLRSKSARGAAFVGSGRGEPLVLLHGVGLRLEVWAPQIATLSRSHRVIALDLPGHGESAPLARGARLPDFVRWLGDALDDLALSAASVAGHSMGALIALGAALEFPDRAVRAALLSAVFRRSAAARRAVVDRAAMLEAGEVDVEAPLDRWFGADESAARADTRRLLRQADKEGYATAYRAFAEGDNVYADRLSELRCPALFLTGAEDPNSTPEMARAMAAMVPDGRLVVLRGERHMVGLTAPDAVNAALSEWLSTPAVAGREPVR
jgi:(E)-2-((N-methylformamido)methylene)succinate hydrolase